MRIIEGRQLAGANISPVVRVTIDNQTRQTKVIKSTSKPFYDEVCKTRMFIFLMVSSEDRYKDELMNSLFVLFFYYI